MDIHTNVNHIKSLVQRIRCSRTLFLASLRFCVHYCIDRDTVQKKKPRFARFFCRDVHNKSLGYPLSVFNKNSTLQIFLGPPERARAETGGADQWVLKRREC